MVCLLEMEISETIPIILSLFTNQNVHGVCQIGQTLFGLWFQRYIYIQMVKVR